MRDDDSVSGSENTENANAMKKYADSVVLIAVDASIAVALLRLKGMVS